MEFVSLKLLVSEPWIRLLHLKWFLLGKMMDRLIAHIFEVRTPDKWGALNTQELNLQKNNDTGNSDLK